MIMKYLKLYENFSEDEVLHIFDFDDTLGESPEFEDLVRPLIKEDMTFDELLQGVLNSIGKTINDLKKDGNEIYVDNIEGIAPKMPWIIKDKKPERLYLKTPVQFNFIDDSFPKVKKKWADLYNSVTNTAIVTGRPIGVYNKVVKSLKDLGLEEPNFGLFCYDRIHKLPIAQWKAKTIVDLLRDTGFKKAKFYDDMSSWVNIVAREVESQLPDVEFEGVKISLIEHKERLDKMKSDSGL